MAKKIKNKKKPQRKLEGIGGWLILPIIGLFISIIALLYDLLSVNAMYEFDALIGLVSLVDIGLLAFVIVALVFIFTKKKSAPKVMIAFYITNIVIQLVIAFSVGEASGAVQALIGGVIWIPYFLISKRVKNTFVK